MAVILTEPTDDHKVQCGYCSKCRVYNEVWRKNDVSFCNHCGSKMYHWNQNLFIAIVIFIIIGIMLILI